MNSWGQAAQLVVSPNTIAEAYSQLEHEGLLDLRHGSGAYVWAAGPLCSPSECCFPPSSRGLSDSSRLSIALFGYLMLLNVDVVSGFHSLFFF